MADLTYLGTATRIAGGELVWDPVVIPPRPACDLDLVDVPMRYWGSDDARSFRVVGSSMSPTLLDNDICMAVSSLEPSPHDIVLAQFPPSPALPGITTMVARYNALDGRAFLTKDNPDHARYEREVSTSEIRGVVVDILPRECRSRHENHFEIQSAMQMFRSARRKPPSNLGRFSIAMMQRVNRVLDVPECELLDGRLPSGCFRAFAKAHQPHVGITSRDLLTINPSGGSRVGDLVVACNEQGEPMFGVLRRDGLTDRSPGPFWFGATDPDSSVRFEHEEWHTLGKVVRVDNPSHVALAAGRSHADRMVASRGRKELL